MSKTPNGPSVKLQIQNIHTMDELKMTGNCLKGSRHVLSFDEGFDSAPHMQLMKELLTQVSFPLGPHTSMTLNFFARQIFAVPRTSRKTKPFVDHVLSFSYLDGRIWFRNYQIVEPEAHEGASELASAADPKDASAQKSRRSRQEGPKAPTLTEIGPRFVMTPIKIFEGSFGGATLFDNPGESKWTPFSFLELPLTNFPLHLLTRIRLAQCCAPCDAQGERRQAQQPHAAAASP